MFDQLIKKSVLLYKKQNDTTTIKKVTIILTRLIAKIVFRKWLTQYVNPMQKIVK